MTAPEEVVLCSEDGLAIGRADKATVHTRETPLHLAFSCYVVAPSGEVLVTRRAASKKTWPGVRTNSCCGHPAPGEGLYDAVERRLRQELGIDQAHVELISGTFRYRAAMPDGTVENELCPIVRALVPSTAIDVDAREVQDAWWQTWADFTADPDGVDPLSPWSRLQIAELRRFGRNPLTWAVSADPAALPAAAVGPAIDRA